MLINIGELRAGRDEGEEEPLDSLAGERQERVPEVVTAPDQQADMARIREISSLIARENQEQV